MLGSEQLLTEMVCKRVIQLPSVLVESCTFLLHVLFLGFVRLQFVLVVEVCHQIIADSIHYGDIGEELRVLSLEHY